MNTLALGCIPSTIDGSEHIFGVTEMPKFPDTYSYVDIMCPILNQGSAQICVPCTVSSYLNWRENLEDGSSNDNNIKMYDIYKSRTNYGEGMTYKDALKFLNKTGVNSDKGILKINAYAMVTNPLMLKMALIMNGPCFGALPVFNDNCKFWQQNAGDGLQGYHAIAIVGFDEEGFIIRNSWGRSFCRKGYTTLPYEEFNRLIEIWTVIK